MLGYEKNATIFYIDGIFSCLQAVISQSFIVRCHSEIFQTFSTGSSSDYETYQNKCQWLVLNLVQLPQIMVPWLIVHDLNQAPPNPPPIRG